MGIQLVSAVNYAKCALFTQLNLDASNLCFNSTLLAYAHYWKEYWPQEHLPIAVMTTGGQGFDGSYGPSTTKLEVLFLSGTPVH